jgi:uncharacterized protein
MTPESQAFTDAEAQTPGSAFGRPCVAGLNVAAAGRYLSALLLVVLLAGAGTIRAADADGLTRGTAAYSRGDYVRAVKELSPLARRGNAQAMALLGFMYEHGFGAPQFYDAAADLYARAAAQGNPFAQSMLGLMYDKGHGVAQNVVLAYKWLNLAAARAPKRQREVYLRFRDAVASKMSPGQIAEGQWLASTWTPERW